MVEIDTKRALHLTEKLLLTAAEAADLCSLSVRKFQRCVSAGQIPKPALGADSGSSGRRWSRLELEAFFSERR